MALLLPTRSLGATLTAAASSFALFAAANWRECYPGVGEDAQLFAAIPWYAKLTYLLMNLVQPLHPFITAVQNSLRVRIMRKWMHENGVHPDSHTLSIITLCPILVQIPDSHPSASLANDRFELAEYLGGTCPLQLFPRPSLANPADASQSHSQGTRYIHLRQPSSDIVGSALFSPDPAVPQSMAERRALMVKELEPEYKQLSYMREKSRFQALVTALQAGGYMLTVAERLVRDLEVSPLEAAVAFYSVLTFCQLVAEVYACGQYRQPLLLRLTSQQFTEFLATFREDSEFEMPWHFRAVSMVLGILATLLAAIPTYLILVYYRQLECVNCTRTTLTFLIGTCLSIVPELHFILVTNQPNRADAVADRAHRAAHAIWSSAMWSKFPLWMFLVPFYACMLVTLASLVCIAVALMMALIVTIQNWDLFNMERIGDNSFAWLLPHVSS